jgi:thermitase
MTVKNVVLSLALATMIALPLWLWATPVQSSPPAPPPLASGRILVKFEPGTSPAEKAAVHRLQGGKPVRVIPGIEVEVVRVPARAEEIKAAGYARSPHVAYAEPDYIAHAQKDPNDTSFAKQWGLDNDGQAYDLGSGTQDADIDWPEAWGIAIGPAEVVIAILDSGIDQDHPDLSGKLVDNANFTDSSTVDDNYGHGTHVAGIAAANTNNAAGVAGVGYNSSLLNVKVLNDVGWGGYSWVAAGIVWAADNGAQVINMSLGYYRKSFTLQDAVDYAWGKGVLLVAAAGNDGSSRKLYPAAYSNCIAVAATDDDDQRVDEPGWWASNYGDWVEVAAPGLYIYSTFPDHDYYIGKSLKYDYGSGTSMSTPFVAGLAGLLFGQDTSRTNDQVRALIASSADPIPGTGILWIHGRINACKAVGGDCVYELEEPPPEPTPTPLPDPGSTMHVANIDMEYTAAGKNYFVYTRVTIVDENNSPIVGAAVDVKTTLGQTVLALSSGATDVDGIATFSIKSKQKGTYSSEVTHVAHSSYTYDPASNVESTETVTVP